MSDSKPDNGHSGSCTCRECCPALHDESTPKAVRNRARAILSGHYEAPRAIREALNNPLPASVRTSAPSPLASPYPYIHELLRSVPVTIPEPHFSSLNEALLERDRLRALLEVNETLARADVEANLKKVDPNRANKGGRGNKKRLEAEIYTPTPNKRLEVLEALVRKNPGLVPKIYISDAEAYFDIHGKTIGERQLRNDLKKLQELKPELFLQKP